MKLKLQNHPLNFRKNNSAAATHIVTVSVIHLSHQVNDKQKTELRGFTFLRWRIQTEYLSWNHFPSALLFMPFNNGWSLKYDHMLLIHVGIYRDPTVRRRMQHFPVREEEAIRIHRCSTGGDKYHPDCFCIDKPPLIKDALRGDADKVAPSEWNDKSVKYPPWNRQTALNSSSVVPVGGVGERWEATAGDILTKIYNTPENLTGFHFLKEGRLSSQHPNKRAHVFKALNGFWCALILQDHRIE